MYINLPYTKRILGLDEDDTSRDAALQDIIAASCDMIERSLRFKVLDHEVTEYKSGNRSHMLLLSGRYVSAVTHVYEDAFGWFGDNPSGFDTSTELVAGVNYAWEKPSDGGAYGVGRLRRIGGVWSAPRMPSREYLLAERDMNRGNYKIVYRCGWQRDDIPADLKFATALVVGMSERVAASGGPTTGFSFEGFSESYGDTDPTSITRVQSILKGYRKWIWPR